MTTTANGTTADKRTESIMKAAILTHYAKHGTDLEIRDIPVPQPGDTEVLVKIIAAAVNPARQHDHPR